MTDQGKVRALAFYLPQFHPVEENDRAWGAGFTEWTNVVKARPAFPGHDQPHLPADLGFYDLRVPETRVAQAELAAAHGIDGFCYYHYWFAGRRVLERPFAEVLSSGLPDFPFCLCWANEDWRANWDGATGEVLLAQTYSDDDDRRHAEWLLEAFADPRYIRIDGRPLFLVYRPSKLPDPHRTAATWRAAVRAAGLGELLLARVESFPDERSDPAQIGFDAAVEFAPDWALLGQADPRLAPLRVHDYERLAERMLTKPPPGWRRWPGVTPRWDNTPRRPADALLLSGSTPEGYRRWVAAAVARAAAEAGDGEALLFVNAWNEWGEGAHLEPDQRWGHAYLQAHAAGLAAGRRLAALPEPDRAGVEA
jgi:lipopolysaccharide biosynthesis protein